MIVEIPTKKIPSLNDIEVFERKIQAMKRMRETAKRLALETITDLAADLDPSDALRVIGVLQSRVRSDKSNNQHRKVRGSPVSKELKQNLEVALKQEGYSLSQLSRMFNLSVSYISRVKRAMREDGQLSRNAYTDRQLKHHKPEQVQVPA